MNKYIGDLLMGGFAIVVIVQALRHPKEVIDLTSSFAGTYTKSVNDLATAG